MKPNLGKIVGWIAVVLVIGLLWFGYYSDKNKEVEEIPLSELASEVSGGKVDEILIKDNIITAKFKDGGEVKSVKEPVAIITE